MSEAAGLQTILIWPSSKLSVSAAVGELEVIEQVE